MDDETWLDATAQADLVRRGEASPRELVEAAIARIEAVNPKLIGRVRGEVRIEVGVVVGNEIFFNDSVLQNKPL